MIKILPPGTYDFGEPMAKLIKMASGGLRGNDRAVFEKRAGADFLKHLPEIRNSLHPGEELIHLLALGAGEFFGSNRNGDFFSRHACQNYHPTFEKYAKFFRSHKNKDPRKSYGRVVKASYNEPMQRVELLCALYGTKQAAERYQALIADKEMEKLAADKEIPVSMACKIPRDFCSYCKHAAATTEEYCTSIEHGGQCKAGGLRDNIGALVEVDGDTHHLCAHNPDPCFFDISHVFRPADRIAYVSGLLEKAAADGKSVVVKSADLARQLGVTVPYDMLIDARQPANVQRLIKRAYQLAEIESDITRGVYPLAVMSAAAVSPQVQVTDQALPLPPLFREKFAVALRALADARISLPLQRFVEITCAQSPEKAAAVTGVVGRELPGVFSRLLDDPAFPDRLAECTFSPAPGKAPMPFAVWAEKNSADLSLRPAALQRRASLAALRELDSGLRNPLPREKTASFSEPAGRLAEQYAHYQLAFLDTIPETSSDFALTASLLVLQNHAN